MNCEVDKSDGIIHISGDMTIYSATLLKEGLLAALDEDDRECRVDVSGVSEIDTSGLQLLLMVRRLCSAASREFTLLNSSDALREVLLLLKLDSRLRPAAASVPTGAPA